MSRAALVLLLLVALAAAQEGEQSREQSRELAREAVEAETGWRLALAPEPPSRRVPLADAPPEGAQPPVEDAAPRYAELTFGRHSVRFAMTSGRLWVDRDLDGQYEPTSWPGWRRDGATHFRVNIALPIGRGGARQPVPLHFVLDGNELLVGHGLERVGKVELLGRVRSFVLRDGNNDLRFNDVTRDFLIIDADGDLELQFHEGSHERALVREAFRIGEAAFECRTLSPEGRSLEFVRVALPPSRRARTLPRDPAPVAGLVAPGGGEKQARELLAEFKPESQIAALGATGSTLGFETLSAIARDEKQSPVRRAAAVRALGYTAYADRVEFFRRLALGDAPTVVRLTALESMQRAGIAERAAVYARILADDQAAIPLVGASARLLAPIQPTTVATALGATKDPKRRTVLYDALRRFAPGDLPKDAVVAAARQRFPALRAMALRDLFLLDHPDARTLAFDAALEPKVDNTVAESAVRTLGPSAAPESIAVLFDLVVRGNAVAERLVPPLLRAERRERAVRAVAAQLESKHEAARRLALLLLAEMPGKAASEALAARMGKEKNASLEPLLQRALLAHGHPRVVRLLQRPVRRAPDTIEMQRAISRLISMGQRNLGVRRALTELLRWRNWEARVLVLRQITVGPYDDLAVAAAGNLRHRLWQVRLSAAEALGRLRVHESLAPLIAALKKEKQDRVRTAIGAALASLTGKRLGDSLELWERWYAKEGESFRVPAKPFVFESKGGAKKKGETKTVATFYGIPVDSNRVAFVLDRSGSMDRQDRTDGRTRLARAKIELVKTVEDLPSHAKMNVIFFGTGAHAWRTTMVPVNRSNRRVLDEFLSGIDARGATELYDALALALLQREVETIFLLSDGQPTGRHAAAHEMLQEIARLNRVRRVRIHCIALGYESSLLRRLAEQNDGVYERR
ncbi:MAG: VWA domain-containing protein [Planctomycetota bacterium]